MYSSVISSSMKRFTVWRQNSCSSLRKFIARSIRRACGVAAEALAAHQQAEFATEHADVFLVENRQQAGHNAVRLAAVLHANDLGRRMDGVVDERRMEKTHLVDAIESLDQFRVERQERATDCEDQAALNDPRAPACR